MNRVSIKLITRYVAATEGGAVDLPIAQVSECIRHTLDALALHYTPAERAVFFEQREDKIRKGGKK